MFVGAIRRFRAIERKSRFDDQDVRKAIPNLDDNGTMSEVSKILEAMGEDMEASTDALLPLVYEELRALARVKLNREAALTSFQTADLVHEAWFRLVGDANSSFANRAHFFGAASEAMRRILVNNARARNAQKRGKGKCPVELRSADLRMNSTPDEILELEEALEKFEVKDPEKATLVKLRYFVGLSLDEVADLLGVSAATVDRRWAYARAWLFAEIKRMRNR